MNQWIDIFLQAEQAIEKGINAIVINEDMTKSSALWKILFNNRKVTRLGIEPRPSGKIPDALTTELSGLTGTIHYVLFVEQVSYLLLD